VDDGRAFGDGVVDAIRLWGWLLAILLTERLIASLPVRFLVLALSMVAITAVEQLIFDGGPLGRPPFGAWRSLPSSQ
jgi:hypothetical protein